ncbi:hypothetical protein DCCM_2980 [Desulfocucumis palustris]|uniref:C_GCAxxG_C_C family protein n=1 Tax=Desulfocucumis palustris TaxID=1898651 RepID=A0A2L2XC19_9FIRM|nr:C-GCAxxG-C-C family protein [Desulfocucumis palustris]GBF33869.1 hypothetical protein DCCM_2980 [Desulfocucumis palustris]
MNDSIDAAMMMKDSYLCSQAVFATLGEQCGIERNQALKLSTGFGAGIARRGDICGAVSGAIMAIGLKHGNYEVHDVDARDKVFFLAQKLIEGIKARHGCHTCRGLTGIDFTKPEGLKLFEEKGIGEKICIKVIMDCVDTVKEIW